MIFISKIFLCFSSLLRKEKNAKNLQSILCTLPVHINFRISINCPIEGCSIEILWSEVEKHKKDSHKEVLEVLDDQSPIGAIVKEIRQDLDLTNLPNHLRSISATPLPNVKEWHASVNPGFRNHLVHKL